MAKQSEPVTYVASKPLTIEGQQIKPGEAVGSIATSIPLERLLNGVANGALIAEAEFKKIETEKKTKAAG